MAVLPDIQEVDVSWLKQGPLGPLPVARVFLAEESEYPKKIRVRKRQSRGPWKLQL